MTTLLYILLAALFGLLAWRNTKLATKVLVGILPIYLLRIDFFGVPSTMLEILIWVLLVVWVVSGLKNHNWKFAGFKASIAARLPFFPIRLPLTLLLVAAVISTLIAPDLFAALGILKAYYIEPLLLFVLIGSTFDREDVKHLFCVLGGTVLALAVFAIFQRATGVGIPPPWDTARRATGLFPYPNALGLFVAPILAASPFLIAHYWRKVPAKHYVFWITVLALGFVSVVLSLTEAAWIAVPVAVVAAAILRGRKKDIGLLIGALFVIGLALIPIRDAAVSKLTLQDYSGQVRLSQWSETWDYLSDGHWLLGAGLSGYPTAVEPYHTDTQYEIFQYPHNIFLNVWVELGILGLVVFIWLGLRIFALVRKNKNDLLVLAAFAGLLQMFIHGLVDVPIFKNDLAILVWIFVIVILIANRNQKHLE